LTAKLGLDAGLRVILSEGLKEINKDWELPDYEGGIQTLNMSSINLKAFLSLQF